MADERHAHEPAMVVKQSKILWVLVAAILWLAYQVGQIPLMIEKILHREFMTTQQIVDHEMDDTNDNYEESLNLILQGKGAYDILQAFHCNLTQDEVMNNANADIHGSHGEH